MREVIIAEAVRTPVGKRGGALSLIHPVELSALVLNALVERTGIQSGLVDDVYWGCVTQIGEQSANIARNAVLAAGWPETVPGVTIDRQCGSSQQALHFAVATVSAGQAELVVAGGVESMSLVPLGSNAGSDPNLPYGASVLAQYGDGSVPATPVFQQGRAAEMIAARWGMSRQQLDEFSLSSHAKAAAATDAGAFDAELVSLPELARDEGVRRGGSLASLAALPPAFTPEGAVTAASSSQISDGAAALLVTTAEYGRKLGLRPLALMRAAVVAAGDPVMMLTAPIPATSKALAAADLTLSEIGAFEVNEAFAPVPLAWLAETGAEEKRLNPLGGAIALGHPLGATGARLATTLLHHMSAYGIRYGLQTMCEGGGMANATIFELADASA